MIKYKSFCSVYESLNLYISENLLFNCKVPHTSSNSYRKTTKENLKNFIPKESSLLYGLPKIYKVNVLLRSIVNMIDSLAINEKLIEHTKEVSGTKFVPFP